MTGQPASGGNGGLQALAKPEAAVPAASWPALPYAEWKDTLHAIHMWTQVIGKFRLALTPLVNHWWNSSLQVTPRGLTTGTVRAGVGAFQVDLDFVSHELKIETSRGASETIAFRAMSVAQFYRDVLAAMHEVGVAAPRIVPVPVEVGVAVPFLDDVEVRPYDRDHARAFAAALLKTYLVFERFRSGFLGKASPVQFFWGGFDLASARFSGRRGPAYGGGVPPHVNPHVMHEAYSHELIAAGFWPGNADVPRAEYYSYAMPAPKDLPSATIPGSGGWLADRGEFVLPYEAVRTSADPEATVLEFLESTYAAAADLGHWDRDLLEEGVRCECDPVPARMRRPDRFRNGIR